MSRPPAKRPRMSMYRPKRPITKYLKGLYYSIADSTQVNGQLLDVQESCTLVGLRWQLRICQKSNATTDTRYIWAIVKCKGNDYGSITSAANNSITTIYSQPSKIIVWGMGQISDDAGSQNENVTLTDEGTTQAMRKLQIGDSIYICMKLDADTDDCNIYGGIQFFTKS